MSNFPHGSGWAGHSHQILQERAMSLQIDVLVDSLSEEGEFIGRTSWDAPDVDPIVFLSEAAGQEPLAVGQMRRCRVTSASTFDLEAVPVAGPYPDVSSEK